ncbi:MAG: 16S rRNA (adenine(1518)-N(6)/adenine(1519)-N(6))-dimethyltransferase RsmA [candidate division KSB1 bacterium]|nr:16S rRNA (adenine(1518)-N(6)/adenine(1519)-N(6))-dimethyltransferase RsmA [candidate division KSB1 bacterium]MDZ7275576.1 16S rRNA (adenine(1518)-N(6)/adenine(1519)-N(6))-dimethyltransferase RsmA [candidate division KSB1 bacterium]MDZ7284733.1 16S rRNA (adenine(1518)-N(6)/adenine(1519)-N(6))-dimethyltransferase RsmA [candidate division KSB1 bacterium]MDZ7297848.1 16S rRNA (adenine(1518)-N(6)/adenine(1519)-N(6))-dimethyltransferase RsmA [candidate division KSB1 bacterium]MDZ7308760.1 16S rRNA
MMNPPPGFQPRRSLGQNFLIDDNVARKIVRALAPQPADVIVEIGPGLGALTRHLVPLGCRCCAIEIDERLLPGLRQQFAAFPNFSLLHADFRQVDLQQLFPEGGIRLVGNIPYHITSHIVFTAFAQRHLIRDVTLTLQREVAERLVAQPGSKTYGILSVVCQTYARAALLFTLSGHVFRPKPEVESAVVQWRMQPPPLPIAEEAFYLEVVRTVFHQRRKTLRRSLNKFLPAPVPAVVAGIDLQRRPETLSVREMIELANQLRVMKAQE